MTRYSLNEQGVVKEIGISQFYTTELTNEPFTIYNGIGWKLDNGNWIEPVPVIIPQEVTVEI